MKFALYSERVVLPDGVRRVGILVDKGYIVDIVSSEKIPADFELHDMGQYVVLPGLIDVHVHINEPGRTEWEGFETATKAAAAGGITTVVDMPLNSMPVTTTLQAFERKLQAAKDQLWVDVAFHAGIIPGHLPHLESLLQAGCVAGKAFMIDSGLGDFPATGEEDLRRAMQLLAHYKRPLFAHAELDLGTKIVSEQWQRYEEYLSSRPPQMETAAIKLLIKLCRETGCHVHVVHLSAADALPLLRTAKAEGLPITVETAPHYLYFSAEQIPSKATQFKCAPPIRDAQNQKLLWEGLLDGTIDLIATDHSPCPSDLKLFDPGDFKHAWGGISSLQFLLPSTWSSAQKHLKAKGIKEEDIFTWLAQWLSHAPANLLSLPDKGQIAPGYSADFTIFDPHTNFTVTRGQIYHKHKHTPYLNETFHGSMVQTYLHGQLVYDNHRTFDHHTGKILLSSY